MNTIKAAIYWYDVRHETGGAIDKINLALGRVDGGLIRASNAVTTNYEFVIARDGYGGTDDIDTSQSEMWITGVDVTADNAGCGTNKMLVYYAFIAEDADRDDAEGPALSVVERE